MAKMGVNYMKNIVILGGGYGGVKVLRTLLSKELPKDSKITLIDKNPYHSLKTEFYALASGTVSDLSVRTEFPNDERIHYVFGEVTNIDVERQTVRFKEPISIDYDYLVIGLGSEDAYHGIQGAEEYTQSVQSIAKARIASEKIGNLKAYSNVVVVGAGLSGIEVAAELRGSRPDLNIRLLDRGKTVLKAFEPKVQTYVEMWFRENGIEVIHNSKVDYVEQGAVLNNGISILSDVTVWTAGVRPHKLVRALPFEKDRQERVMINEFHQVPGNENVYIVGDCASMQASPSAQLAQYQGEQIGEVIYSIISGVPVKKPGDIKLRGTLGSLGKVDGFGSIFEMPFTGLIPRVAKSGVLWLHKRH